jgi:hypothetical protein
MIRNMLVSFGISLALALATHANAAPCTTADTTCSEWVPIGDAPQRVRVFRTHPLDQRNEKITRALVVVHGQGRDADSYFRSAVAAAFLAGSLDDTLVVSLRLASRDGRNCQDKLDADELNWVCAGPDSWRSGGGAVGKPKVTSFDVTDTILIRLADKRLFPNVKHIVVAGHSAGGQYVTRYEMVNAVHDRVGIPVSYIVANPSSYTYLDSLRPSASAFPLDVAAGAPGYTFPPPAKDVAPFIEYGDAKVCTGYDEWPYGMHHRVGASAQLTDDVLKKRLAARPVTYLLGELDILPLHGFDSSCGAMAQGPTRLARGLAYNKYVNERFGAFHEHRVVSACGHSARCMFTSDSVLPLLFPKD